MKERSISCEEAIRLIAIYLDGELKATGRRTVERHVEKCRTCYSRVEFERRLKDQLAALRSGPVPPTLETRVRHLISQLEPAAD